MNLPYDSLETQDNDGEGELVLKDGDDDCERLAKKAKLV